MHWGVDAQRLQGQRLGVGRYIEYLVKHWDRSAPADDRVTLYVRRPLPPGDLGVSGRVAVRAVGPSLTGHLWQNLVLPRHASALDVLFCPSYSMPLRYDGRCVVAIHSTNEVEPGTHPWWYKFTYTPIYQRSAERAERVIVPSESTRQDVQAYYGIPASKIDVVPQGADESFRPIDDPAVRSATRKRWLGDDVPYVVFVGKLSQRRNVPVLLEAFAQLKQRTNLPHKLLLFGPNHLNLPLADLAARLGITEHVVQTDGKVQRHDEVVAVYAAADLYVSASSYEGFSMTLVEALSCGTPVVGVNKAAFAEVASECAVLVDESAPELLAGAMERVLTDPGLAADLRRRSLERAESYRWHHTAQQTLDVLRRVAEAN